MDTRHGNYHRCLRIGAVVLAFALLFESGVVSESTARLADTTEQYMANAVGISVGVEPTELNQYTAELTARERELEEREAAVAEREIAVNLNTDSTASGGEPDTTTYLLASILFILLVLIILNYALDYLRAREERGRTLQAV